MGKVIAKSASNGTSPPRAGFEQVARSLSPTDRDRILQAMIECAAERGYLQTSVTDVLARADVRREVFEALFKDKEECAVAALRMISSEAMRYPGPLEAGTEPPLMSELSGIKALVELMAARPGYAYFSCVEARQGGTSRMHEIYESSARVLCAMIERARGPDDGAERPGAVRAALGGAEAVVRREIAAGRSARVPRLIPDLTYSVLVPVLGQREALRQHARIGALLEEGSP
jgi:AcrR family transcriptional regulator